MLHSLGPLESQLEGEEVVAKRLEEQVSDYYNRVNSLNSFNRKQSASLANSKVFLDEVRLLPCPLSLLVSFIVCVRRR